uniref:Uncharacterized protein n=1 Tax=Solanum lycopersicum TaxID=4081 RepID=A0A3Q7GIA5_SOLLC
MYILSIDVCYFLTINLYIFKILYSDYIIFTMYAIAYEIVFFKHICILSFNS